jgi:hypothetical protein
MKSLLMVAAAILIGNSAIAHEGHDLAPGALKANHGGVVKAGKEINLEYVVSGTDILMYPLSHDGKDISASTVKLNATAKSPKGKEEPLKLSLKDGAYAGAIDFKGAYRTEVKVGADISGKKDSFKFQVEK